ncbi:MAG: diguanylate cyclase [Acidimicrobiales bacterium]
MVTEEEWEEAQKRQHRLRFLSCAAGMVILGAVCLPAMALGAAITGGGIVRYLVSAGILIGFVAPSAWAMIVAANKQQRDADGKVRQLNRDLSDAIVTAEREAAQRRVQARRQQFESRLANALDMADGEPEVIDVIERSLASVVPDSPAELLLADNSHAHLLRMASVSPTGEPPACDVDSPDRCPAARRAQVQRFSDSDDLDACPKLRNRVQGRLSALCVPVSIMGRTVGVIHATGAPQEDIEEDSVEDLETLAKLAGARIGLLRVMAETQLQAATDSLTGLFNRRMFEEKVSGVRRETDVVAVAMVDFDHFKILNDTYGHETGDRALVLFAQVLKDSFRSQDLFCRYGGEEFAIAFPACTAEQARNALDAFRSRLSAAIAVAGLPSFTVSAGIVDAKIHENLPGALDRADAALYQAKLGGRDQVVVHDPAGEVIPVADNQFDHNESSRTVAAVSDVRRQLR